MNKRKIFLISLAIVIVLSAIATTLDITEDSIFSGIVHFNPPGGKQQIKFTLSETEDTGPEAGAIHIDNSNNNGHALTVYSNKDSSANGALIRLTADNSEFDKPLIWLINKGTTGSSSGIRIDSPRPEIEFYETDEISPRGVFELRVNDNKLEIGTRKADNSGFEYPYTFTRAVDGASLGIQIKKPKRNIHINDTMRLEPRSSPPSSPSLGDIYVNKDSHELCFYDGKNWVGLVNEGSCV